jgi:hypothetical protein
MEGIPGVTSQRLSRAAGDELLGGSFLFAKRRSKERAVRRERRRGDRGVRGTIVHPSRSAENAREKMMRSAEAVLQAS